MIQGCNNNIRACSDGTVLSGDGFTFDGTNYRIVELAYYPAGDPGLKGLYFTLDKEIPATIRSSGTLYVNGGVLSFADAVYTDSNKKASWDDTGSLWGAFAEVLFSVTAPGTPLPTGVEISKTSLAIGEDVSTGSGTFTVALSDDPGADTTVTLVRTQYYQSQYGSSRHVWDLNAASVSPETLTFTAGASGNYATAQTVTVTGVEDADQENEQLLILVLVQTAAANNNERAHYTPVGSSRTVAGIHVTVADDDCAGCGREGDLGRIPAPEDLGQPPGDEPSQSQEQDNAPYADLISQMHDWRNDPQWVSYKSHTDRWDRALMAFGETVSDSSLTAMTASEAQGYADASWGARWVPVAEALHEIEAAAQQPAQNQNQDPPPQQPQANRAPTVAVPFSDVVIVNESGTADVSLVYLSNNSPLLVFADADGDDLTITGASSDVKVATVSSVSRNTLTVSAKSRGTATITVTADDGNGGTVSDSFTVKVKSAPTVASAISDVTGLEAGTTQLVSLSGVFSDADGDALTITAGSDDDDVADVTVADNYSALSVEGVAEGEATIHLVVYDADGNQVVDSFDVSVTAAQPTILVPPGQQQPQPQLQAPEPTPTPTPEPTPTPTPEPEDTSPQETETSDIVARYDTDGDGKISRTELGDAIRAYSRGEMTYSQFMEIYLAFRAS